MIESLRIAGFRSIEEQELHLTPVNVLVGANGAGKSNLVLFLRMLGFIATGRLQLFVGLSGQASSLLHYGPKRTSEMSASVRTRTPSGSNLYEFRLAFGEGDRLFFSDERVYGLPGSSADYLGAGHLESRLGEMVDDPAAVEVHQELQGLRDFHFHDTSRESPIRTYGDEDAGRYLRSRGENLAAFLYRLKGESSAYYERIRATIRRVAPFFDDFVLVPAQSRKILLRWRSHHAEDELGPQHLSDGTLRFMALTALFLQPESQVPRIVVIDEPELGLHPLAIQLLCEMVKSAAANGIQIVLATQSTNVLDSFAPADVVVVEQVGGASRFQRPDASYLQAWLEEYSLSELWEKNVIGGRPR